MLPDIPWNKGKKLTEEHKAALRGQRANFDRNNWEIHYKEVLCKS